MKSLSVASSLRCSKKWTLGSPDSVLTWCRILLTCVVALLLCTIIASACGGITLPNCRPWLVTSYEWNVVRCATVYGSGFSIACSSTKLENCRFFSALRVLHCLLCIAFFESLYIVFFESWINKLFVYDIIFCLRKQIFLLCLYSQCHMLWSI